MSALGGMTNRHNLGHCGKNVIKAVKPQKQLQLHLVLLCVITTVGDFLNVIKNKIGTIFQVCLFGWSPESWEAIPDKDRLPGTSIMLSSYRAAVSMTTVECFYQCGFPFKIAPPCQTGLTQNGRLSTDKCIKSINQSTNNESIDKSGVNWTDRLALQDFLFHRLQADVLQDESRDNKHTSCSVSSSASADRTSICS